MSAVSRMVFMNGTDKKCKILGFRKHSVVVQGKHRKIYYNSDQVKMINKTRLGKLDINSEMPFTEVLV